MSFYIITNEDSFKEVLNLAIEYQQIMRLMNTQTIIEQIIEQRVTRKNLCISLKESDVWFSLPIFVGSKVTVFISSQRDQKYIVLHIRWHSDTIHNKQRAKIKCDESVVLDCGISIEPVVSKKTGKQVVRFIVNIPVSDILNLLSEKQLVFISDSYSELLNVSEDKLSIAYFIAKCYGFDQLSEDLMAIVNDAIGWEVKMKESSQKREAEKERQRQIQYQKRLEAKEKVPKQAVEPSVLEAKKQDFLQQFAARFVNLIVTDLNKPSSSRFYNHDRRSEETYYYVLSNIDVDKAYHIIEKDKELNANYKGITISLKRLLSFLEQIGILYRYKYKDDSGQFYYGFLKLDNQQVIDMIKGKLSYKEVAPKLLVRSYIQKAKLETGLITKEYRVYDYNSRSDGFEVLEQKGIISSGGYGDGDRHWIILYVNDFNKACDIIDGNANSPVKNTNTHKGCYIATCVYGSYDCPEVWTLRRFRDQALRYSWIGRVFIKVYYATSPTLVKWFGNMKFFRTINRSILDKWVSNLNKNGFDNKPYQDR